MVLIWGLPEDSPTARIAKELYHLNSSIAWVNQQEIPNYRIKLEMSDEVNGTLHFTDRTINLGDVTGAYIRPYELRSLNATRGLSINDPKYHQISAFEEILHVWVETSKAIVMNRLSAMASNGSKPLQAGIIRQFGFSIPETLITTNPEEVLSFWDKHHVIIYKSISGHRSVVSKVTEEDRERLSTIKQCPTQFQQHISGVDYRAHIIGDHIFACRIKSAATDYRYDHSTEIQAVELPVDVADRAFRLTKGLGLELGGVDLRESTAGEWFCFEVNPSPGFTYYEDATGLPMAAAIASTLVGSSGK